ncbi:hypothetical protein B0I35DRAFT_483572 [Stachybotrys elegans]|uniref:Fungal lipase-type domain-containing protein n=1 Tax=Stachybotrys elegans TaxID=80388 RepID=A0A8K0SEB4_9HYPO|nr:hypothetical protein B0I35DRAFT_483572 [Stachybotrys elegans]
MDFNNLIVSVELDDDTFRGLQANGAITNVVKLRDKDVSTLGPRENQFRLQGIAGNAISPYTNNATFSLVSISQGDFLGINSSDRTLMLSPEQFPPPDAFRFVFKPGYGPFSTEIPCAIQSLDKRLVKSATDPTVDIHLCIRSIQRLQDDSSQINTLHNQQICMIAALQDANVKCPALGSMFSLEAGPAGQSSSTVLGILPNVDPEQPQSYLDIQQHMLMAQEMVESGELDTAKAVLGASYTRDNLPNNYSSKTVFKLAKLFTILNKTVYLRDLEFDKKVLESAIPYSKATADAYAGGSVDAKTAEYFKKVDFYNDKAQSQINNVGSGPLTDWYTNTRWSMVPTADSSPLEGHIHEGFYKGLFGYFPIGMRGDDQLEFGLPFLMEAGEEDPCGEELAIDLSEPDPDMDNGTSTDTSSQSAQMINAQGHSLGGAYATVFWTAAITSPHVVGSTFRDLLTLGSPRVGDRAFCESVNRLKKSRRVWRFVNGSDVVPNVPNINWMPNLAFYHIDTMVNVQPHGIVLGSSELKLPQAPTSWIGQWARKLWDKVYWALTNNDAVSSIPSYIATIPSYLTDHFLENYWSAIRDGAEHSPEELW